MLNQVRPAEKAGAGIEGNASSSQESQANPQASKAQTMYSGGAVFDPEAWKTLFPDIAERFSDWVNDKQDEGDKQGSNHAPNPRGTRPPGLDCRKAA